MKSKNRNPICYKGESRKNQKIAYLYFFVKWNDKELKQKWILKYILYSNSNLIYPWIILTKFSKNDADLIFI